ncbi:hypothetical protein VB713_14625 [Anabaena cylindrica UHCC 0172]|nr:hypothetical protein [Anabaena cylindrica]MEA5552177.1 hypothetical protein [Anabaena cylindrica UHCC 0172]
MQEEKNKYMFGLLSVMDFKAVIIYDRGKKKSEALSALIGSS